LGLKAGFTNYSNNLEGYTLPQNGVDPSFQGKIDKMMLNFGAGAFYYGKKFYVGLSVPKMINNKFENDLETFTLESELRHYYLMAGMVFDLGENVKFKPTSLVKSTFSSSREAPVQLDLTANFLFKEKFWLGAMYRTGDSFGVIAQWIFDKKLRIGYAFDMSTSNLQNYNNGSHEVMVSYELKFLKENVISPRYF
jgi:type IX secretion system PorP/SprF family membrane protein